MMQNTSRRLWWTNILTFSCGFFLMALTAGAETLLSGTHANPAELIRACLLQPSQGEVFIASHRGDWRNFAENSLPGIESCIQMGVPIVEVDVRKTRDGHFILMHDASVDRTTTGKGLVEDLTLEEIRNFHLRNGIQRATEWRVPTLEEALNMAKGKVLLNLDKCYDDFPEIVSILKKTGTIEQVILKPGANTPVEKMLQIRGDDPESEKVLIMPLVNLGKEGGMERAREYLHRLKPFAMEIVYSQWKPEYEALFEECVQNGTKIWINTLWKGLAGDRSDDRALKDPEDVYGWLLEKGVTIIQTDRPQLLQKYLAEQKWPVVLSHPTSQDKTDP